MTGWQIDRAWWLYRRARAGGASDGWFNDALWSLCVKQVKEGSLMVMPPVTDEEFIVIWQKCAYPKQVAQLCGYTSRHAAKIVSHRASRLRKAGVPLKRFRCGGGAKDFAKLTWMSARAAGGGQ